MMDENTYMRQVDLMIEMTPINLKRGLRILL